MSMSGSMQVPSKVVVKSNTTQTLSDRFTEIMQMKSPPQVTITGIRSMQAASQQEATRKKRFQQQMRRRPGMEEAFQAAKTANLKSRLVLQGRGGARGRGQARGLNHQRVRSSSRGSARGIFRSPGRGRINNQRGGRGNRGLRSPPLGGRGQGARGGFGKRLATRGRGQLQGRGRGNSRRRGRGRGRGRGRNKDQGGPASKEQLDKELDAYMNESGPSAAEASEEWD